MTKIAKPKRPTFQYEQDNVTYDIKAGGILFYKIEDNSVKFLMIRNRDRYEDFGGCTDNCDKNIQDTIAREVEEESNKLFSKSNILERMGKTEPIINKTSKYLLYILKLVDHELQFTGNEFGTHETHDDIDRTVEIVDIDKFKDSDFLYSEVNFRLRFREFYINIFNLSNVE